MSPRIRVQIVIIIGSLSKDDSDGNENGKKTNRIRLTKQEQLYKCIPLFVHLQSTPDNWDIQGKSKKGSSYREFEENSRE